MPNGISITFKPADRFIFLRRASPIRLETEPHSKHIRTMPEKPPHQRSDLDKAREIVKRHGTFVGPAGSMLNNVELVVAEGIALGRKEGIAEGIAIAAEGIELVEEAIARLKNSSRG